MLVIFLVIIGVLSALFAILPSTLAILIVTIVGLAAVIFSWLFLRRTFFRSINFKTREVDWRKYAEIKTLNAFGLVWGVLVALVFLVIFVMTPQSTTFLRDFATLILFFIVLSSLIRWKGTSLRQNLDEYHPKLDGLIVEDPPENNQLRLPARCHKGDSHNICLRIVPARNYESGGWEAELQAVGVNICGKPIQRSPITAPKAEILFFWNCHFENAGNYLVNVLLRTTTDQGSVKQEVLRKSHEIKVITPYRQYATTLVTAIVALLTFLLTLLSSLHPDMTSVLQSLLQSLHI